MQSLPLIVSQHKMNRFHKCNFSFSMQMHLNIDDLNDILTELLPCAVKWEGLGLNFGLTKDDLAPIERKCRGDDQEALKEMLAKVLYRKKITWETIVVAVRSVERDDVADAIIEKKQLAGTLYVDI